MLAKQGKTTTSPQLASSQGLASNWTNMTINRGKCQKDKWFHFHAGACRRGGVVLLKKKPLFDEYAFFPPLYKSEPKICRKQFQDDKIRGKRKGGEHRRGEGSETFLERKWLLRRFPGAS